MVLTLPITGDARNQASIRQFDGDPGYELIQSHVLNRKLVEYTFSYDGEELIDEGLNMGGTGEEFPGLSNPVNEPSALHRDLLFTKIVFDSGPNVSFDPGDIKNQPNWNNGELSHVSTTSEVDWGDYADANYGGDAAAAADDITRLELFWSVAVSGPDFDGYTAFGVDNVLWTGTVVPEPASLLAFGLLGAGLGIRRRR
jgi:hypothetical protein